MSKKTSAFVFAWLLVASFLISINGCIQESANEVVVYCALDKEFSESILDRFEAETGIRVLAKFDQESNKTVGLANEIIQQSERQRCDLFWNNEILHTLRLKHLGLLDAYVSPLKTDYPPAFVSADSDWYGFAARARVLLVNTNLLPTQAEWPDSVSDLADPVWKGNCSIAKPLFGTTATHAAVLYAQLGQESADEFFADVSRNAIVENGNKQVAINVSRGKYAFGLTDTDDAIIEVEQGNPVAIVFPDQRDSQPGALLIPNTLCVIKGGANGPRAKILVDYLLQQDVEKQLALGRSAQLPLNKHSKIRSRVAPESLKVMPVDFEAAAAGWERIKERLKEKFPL